MLDRPKFQTMVIKSTSLKSTDEAEQKHTMACDRHMYKQKHLSLKKQTTHTHQGPPMFSRSIDRSPSQVSSGWMDANAARQCVQATAFFHGSGSGSGAVCSDENWQRRHRIESLDTIKWIAFLAQYCMRQYDRRAHRCLNYCEYICLVYQRFRVRAFFLFTTTRQQLMG